MGKSSKAVLKKGPWTREEDQKLMSYIQQHGHGSWCSLPAKAGLKRCGKSCRLRWTNYLRPDVKRGRFSLQEDQTIIQLHALLGNRWSAIALHLPKRTDNDIKNHWNTHLKKRLIKMGIDPTTHKPLKDTSSKLNHMAQWETARLQAEARLVKQSKPRLHMIPPPPPPLTPCLDVLKAWQNSRWPTTITVGDNNIPKMHNMYAMNQSLLTPSSKTVGENSSVGSLLRDDGDIMVAVEAFRSSRVYNCKNAMEGVDNINEDVLLYGFNEDYIPSQQNQVGGVPNNDGEEEEGISSNFVKKQFWETILNLVNDDFPPSDHHLQFPTAL